MVVLNNFCLEFALEPSLQKTIPRPRCPDGNTIKRPLFLFQLVLVWFIYKEVGLAQELLTFYHLAPVAVHFLSLLLTWLRLRARSRRP